MARGMIETVLRAAGLQRRAVLILAALLAAAGPAPTRGGEPGNLLIVGGGLNPDNAEVFGAFISLAGGPGGAKIGVFPTASPSVIGAQRVVERLEAHGLPAGSAEVVPITRENAALSVRDPAILEKIRGCTGLFFAGGDQSWIARVFLEPDGSDTPALEAVRSVYRRGGVVAGSSAGAAAISGVMISSRGVAVDTLDFGLGSEPHHRGVIVARGLGFFDAGPIDQHFNHRGRLARLARVLIERKMPLGFGIDEDTAMLVRPDGSFEVLGRGGVTVVDASDARGEDGPLGFRARGLRVDYIERGDRFDPATKAWAVHAAKAPVTPDEDVEDEVGLITDLGQQNAVRRALTAGLVESPVDRRDGLFLRYSSGNRQGYGYGYRFTFSKTEATRGYLGQVGDRHAYTVLGVRLDIDPVTCTLDPPATTVPSDLAAASAKEAIEAVVFRGLMPTDESKAFRPAGRLTRAEFAHALARAAAARRRGPQPQIADLAEDAPFFPEVAAVVSAGLMGLDGYYTGQFDSFANAAIAQMLGALLAVWALKMVRTVGAEQSALRLLRAGWRDLALRTDPRQQPDTVKWINTMLDRIGLLTPRLAELGSDTTAPLLDILRDTRVGMSLDDLHRFRVHAHARDDRLLDVVLGRVRQHFDRLGARGQGDPDPALVRAIDTALATIGRNGAVDDRRLALLALTSLRRNIAPDIPLSPRRDRENSAAA